MTAEDVDYNGIGSEIGSGTGSETGNRIANANVGPIQCSTRKDNTSELESCILDLFIALLDYNISNNEY